MKNTAYFIVLAAFWGCGSKSSGGSQASRIPSEGQPFQKLLHTEPAKKTYSEAEKITMAFAKLKDACIASGNSFNERDMLCECPSSDVPVSFSLKTTSGNPKDVKPSCVRHERYSAPDGYSSFKDMLSKNKDGFISTISFMGSTPSRAGVATNFRLGDSQKDSAYAEIASALDEQPLYIKSTPRFRWYGSYRVHIGWDYSNDSSEYFLAANIKQASRFAATPGRTKRERRGVQLLGFVSNPRNISKVISTPITGRRGWIFAEVDPADPNFAELSALGEATGTVNKLLGGEIARLPAQKDRVIILEDGCHLRCITTTEFKAKDRLFRYEKLYIYGEIVATRISTFTGDSYFPGMSYSSSVLFGQGILPSVVTVNRKNTEGLAAGWTVDVYDENIKKAQSFTEQHIDEPSFLQAVLKATDSRVRSSAPVVMMDEIVDYRDELLMSMVMKGPFQSTDYTAGGSAFGWLDAKPGNKQGFNYAEFYDGLLDLFYDPHKGNDYHSSFVGRLIAGLPDNSGDTSVIPISKTADLARPDALDEVLTVSGSRVVNISTLLLIDGKKTCPSNNYDLDKRALWISGAGNDGLESPKDSCYQTIAPKHRRMVVAAHQEGSHFLEEYSDRGRDYADIAALGFAYDRHGTRSEGTSYAAPRVSRIAGILVKKYGDLLSNQLIRLAILLSANVQAGNRNETLTGGILNTEGALKAGQFMHDAVSGRLSLPPNLSKKNLMYRIIEASGALTESDQISNQVEWLVEGGI